ncbi:Alpha/Beta hydrolase protein [Apodospora peruviana]|uniref:Alpha/Beta hydrolase protein n=1 Tax=Apodospora peruviana TaxID=516989 RepID=A0AAE0IGV8_9PEZI|nr:Alpha/Beta hydrolase protein [Apodospora peruviana]
MTSAGFVLAANGNGKHSQTGISAYAGLEHPPHLSRLESKTGRKGIVEQLSISVDSDARDGFVPGFLHLPPDFNTTSTFNNHGVLPKIHHRTAAILLSGAGGGVTGPSSIYLSLACKLATLHPNNGIPALRLDYRVPARTGPCVRDVCAAMQFLQDMYGLDRFVLVGWSFGGAVVFSTLTSDEEKRVVGCATVASQTADTEGIRSLAPRPVLLLHGTGDQTLNERCSERLYEMYGESDEGGGEGERRLVLFDGDNHALSGNAETVEEIICEFVARCAGVTVDETDREEVLKQELVEDDERGDLMERGGDLRSPERRE